MGCLSSVAPFLGITNGGVVVRRWWWPWGCGGGCQEHLAAAVLDGLHCGLGFSRDWA